MQKKIIVNGGIIPISKNHSTNSRPKITSFSGERNQKQNVVTIAINPPSVEKNTSTSKHPCQCNGTGKTDMSVTTIGPHGSYEETISIPCHLCKGKGYQTEEEKNTLEKQQNIWCRCTRKSDPGNGYSHISPKQSRYGVDTYTCNLCRRVVQFG